MSDTDPLQPLRVLMQRLGELAESLGIHMETFAVLPNPDEHGRDFVQAVMSLSPEAFMTEAQIAEDKTLRDMELHLRRERTQDKIEEARRKALETAAELSGGEFKVPDPEDLPEIVDAELIECPQCKFELQTSPISNRPDHLFCDRCKWPLVEHTEESLQEILNPIDGNTPLPEPESDEPDYDNMTVEEMLRVMEERERNGHTPDDGLAGV